MKKNFNMRLDVELYEYIKETASETHRTMSQFMIDLVMEYKKRKDEEQWTRYLQMQKKKI